MLTALPADQVAFLQTNFPQSITGTSPIQHGLGHVDQLYNEPGQQIKSRWLSILQNAKQLQLHTRNGNNVAQIQAAHNALANQNEAKWKQCVL